MDSAPTDIQAEVLVTGPIPLDSITGVVAQSDDQARGEICRLNLQGILFDKPIYIVPEFFNRATISRSIQRGNRIAETLYTNGDRHG